MSGSSNRKKYLPKTAIGRYALLRNTLQDLAGMTKQQAKKWIEHNAGHIHRDYVENFDREIKEMNEWRVQQGLRPFKNNKPKTAPCTGATNGDVHDE